MPEIDRENIVAAMAAGENASQIAARLGVSLKQVKVAMRAAIEEMSSAEALRADWFAEDRRLQILGLRFYELALKDNNHQAAIIFLKASERRATLAGANAPQS